MKNSVRFQLAFCLVGLMLILPMGRLAAASNDTVQHESGFYYTVQQGDTLWNISERFYGSSDYWPELWQENPQLPNPHEIYPGERIRLLHDRAVSVAPPPAVAQTAAPAAAPAPEPAPEAPYFYFAGIDMVGFIRPRPVAATGVLFKVTDQKTLIGQGDLVYVKPVGGHTFVPGSRYTLFRTSDPIVQGGSKELIGYQHLLTGVLEINKVLPDFVVARVIKSYRTIRVNDQLTPYERRSPKITLAASPQEITGRIISAEERQYVIGQGHVVFIDRGAADGVTAGQSFVVYYREKHRMNPENREEVQLTPIYMGRLLVLHTEERASTAVITESVKAMHDGDEVLTPIPDILRQ